jgi:alkyl sulfatase BDS1-like metallo-beta-lactamase superfamily hydrolase
LVVFLSCSLGVVHPEEQWYLILEEELQSIEKYRNSREAERQTWLSQVNALKVESVNLNEQLTVQRAANKKLTLSFNEYETDQLTILSLKDGEITRLKETLKETQRKATMRLVTSIVLASLIALYVIINLLFL